MRVPVRHWRTLIHYLCRLDATYRLARGEGRGWIRWHLREDGVIFISAWELTEAERKRRCALPDGFDRIPWTRLAPRDLSGMAGAGLCHGAWLAHWTASVLILHHGCTAGVLPVHPARPPP